MDFLLLYWSGKVILINKKRKVIIMQRVLQSNLFPQLQERDNENDWTFNGANTRQLTHCYHDYPARMIPQIAAKLLDMFGKESDILFDPYCGTGTSLVEAMLRGINAIGTDLNPLACLIAKAKTSIPNLDKVHKEISRFQKFTIETKTISSISLPRIEGIKNIEFWFKPDVITRLIQVKNFIHKITDDSVQIFFKVAFSETVRESSNTRNSEFKLYRYPAEKLGKFNPDVFSIMTSKLHRNLRGLQAFANKMNDNRANTFVRIYNFNSVVRIPEENVRPASIGIVITSPPYGDSRTTVAYGQYSRLSAALLGLREPEKTDRKLMGGKRARTIPEFPSASLNETIKMISQKDAKRAMEVAAFYIDLLNSIVNVSKVIKPKGYACYVVANRKVKGTILPTNDAIRDFFEFSGFEHIDTFERSIPNKRMALRNSPSNISCKVDNTMSKEFIIVMRRG